MESSGTHKKVSQNISFQKMIDFFLCRVSGSQVEINNMRETFERGDDPLADTSDASDINSVAGVLKLYFRELREPLFPIQYFDHFMELARK